ncbi:glycoside hydrolase superfamily [Xylariales sp. PMI_506]|nr:glycoside hydrolase superfamily [Xylariales sp. PMI_506]
MRFSTSLVGLAAAAGPVMAGCGGKPAESSSSSSSTAAAAAVSSAGSVGAYRNSTAILSSSASATTTTAAASSASVSDVVKAVGTSSATSSSAASTSSTAVTKSAANSGIKGFNYAAFFLDYSSVEETDFSYEFARAQNLEDTSGWNSARLYTMIQYGTTDTPITAIQAAIDTQTTLLLGLWISGGDSAITNEITALTAAIEEYGTDFTDLVVGISVGSEDLYRDAEGEVGVDADYLIDCISQVRSAIADTTLSSAPVGHVDTYDSFLNSSNQAVISALDWVGFDGYPYWQSGMANGIDVAKELFYTGYNETVALAGDVPVWVTETGWPVSGDTENEAVASADNARTYWTEIACQLIADGVNVWWYTLQEDQDGTATPDFGIFGAGDLDTLSPRWDLSCVSLLLHPYSPSYIEQNNNPVGASK